MSNSDAKPKLDLDLESAFLPAWAQKSSEDNPYAKFEGRDRDYTSRDSRGRNRGDGPGKSSRQRSRDPRNKGRQQGPESRGGGEGRPGGGPQRSGGGQALSAQGGNDRGGGRGRPQGRGEGRGPQGRGQYRDRPRRSRQEILASLPQLKTQIIPEAKGVALLAKRIRLQGRAYPLFDIAGLILQSPERYHIRFTSQTPPKDQEQQKIWLCKLDQSVWLNEAEAVQHVLQKHLDTYYTAERTETDPPKGSFNFVAQCGMSGVVLGPPNYHGYQARLRELHEERFSRTDFEHFKSKVKIVQDEVFVKKWMVDQSWTTEYSDKNDPETEKLHSLDEVEANFREKHFQGAIECVHSAQISGDPKNQPSRPIRDLIRFHVDDQTRFPLQLATELSQQFTRQGLQFFKVNKTVTHVSVSRPHYLDLDATPVSDMVKRIVQFVDETPHCTRVKILESLAPKADIQVTAAEKETEKEPSSQIAEASPAPEAAPATPTEDSTPKSESSDEKSAESKPAEVTKSEPALTPEQAAVTTDLHWLIHQGHVIEFSNGKLETAKKPKEQPKKKQVKPASKPSESKTSDALATQEKAAEKPVTSTDVPAATSSAEVTPRETKPEEVVQPAVETPESESKDAEVSSDSSSSEQSEQMTETKVSEPAISESPEAIAVAAESNTEPKAEEASDAPSSEAPAADAEAESKRADS